MNQGSPQIEDHNFLSTTFQSSLEEVEYLSSFPADDEKPFEYKYQARKILEQLVLKESYSSLSPTHQIILKGIVYYYLGINYFDTEETYQAEKHFNESLDNFSKLDKEQIIYFLGYIQELYNCIGIIFTNRDDINDGLSLFAKAEELYKVLMGIFQQNPTSVVNNHKSFTYQQGKSQHSQQFRCFYLGGLNKIKVEKNYTLTIFYMAQAYTRLGLKFKAAEYCGVTLKRQYETNDYDLKEWSVNCISLAEFYDSNMEFSQAQYLLMCGLSVIPEKKKKLQATFALSLGHHLLLYLEFAIEKFLENQTQNYNNMIGNETITFEGIEVQFIPLKLPEDKEGLNSIFRQMNTQFKKAMKYFELDGHVTEYIQIVRDLSKAYRLISFIETEVERRIAFAEKRRDLLELPANEINPKAYEHYWQVLTLEIAEIYNDMFDQKYEHIVQKQLKLKSKTMEQMNKWCMTSIEKFESLVKNILQSQNKELINDVDTIQTIITAKFNIGKNFSRFNSSNKDEKVEMLKKSLQTYEWIKSFINDRQKANINLPPTILQTYKNCAEMCDLLPSKIDKVAHGLL